MAGIAAGSGNTFAPFAWPPFRGILRGAMRTIRRYANRKLYDTHLRLLGSHAGRVERAYFASFAITPQAMRSPALPAGSVFISSALA